MNKKNQNRIDEFVLMLEKSLGQSGKQSNDILEEVSADLHAHVSRFRSEGNSEDESVEKALSEMGNPYELGNQVRQEIPPFGGATATVIRYVAASGIMVWLLMLMWLLRGWSYGFAGIAGLVTVTFLHLPVILLLWPRIVWRRNWLFGLIPAGIAFVFALVMNFAGTEHSVELGNISQNGEEFVPAPVKEEPLFPSYYLILAAAVVVTMTLYFAIQQRLQRRMVVLAIVLPIGLVEIVFQVEEHIFRQDRDRTLEYFESTFRERGSYPTEEEFDSNGPRLRASYWIVPVSDDDFSLFWKRPLSSGFSLAFSPKRDEIWIQD
ncbi:MAG: permease prefix domain 1-containing protein [Akkermansiaceae bacterium]